MKRLTYIIIVAFALAGCNKENVSGPYDDLMVLGAIIPDVTKTCVNGSDNTKINWSEGDMLSIWGDDNYAFTLSSGSGSTSALFTGTVTGSPVVALYPYYENAVYDADSQTITSFVNCLQKSEAGSFDPVAALMAGKVDGSGNVAFHNVMAYLKVKVPAGGSPVKAITLTPNDKTKYLSGEILINTSDCSSSVGGTRYWSVEISDASHPCMTAGGEYYVAVIPGSYEAGLTITYTYEDGSAVQISKAKELSVNAGQVKTVAEVDMTSGTVVKGLVNGHPWVDLGVSAKWATRNVGATEDGGLNSQGDYFAYGATETFYTSISFNEFKAIVGPLKTGKEYGYVWVDTPYYTGDGTVHSWSKYNSTDGLTALEVSDDAAHVCYGGNWLIPTKAQAMELLNNCYFQYTRNYRNGGWVKGYIVYKAIDASDRHKIITASGTPLEGYSEAEPCSMFIPYSGYVSEANVYTLYFTSQIWTRDVSSDNCEKAWNFYLQSNAVGFSYANRYRGHSVRAVVIPSELGVNGSTEYFTE